MDERYRGSGPQQGKRDRWDRQGRQDEQFSSESGSQFGDSRAWDQGRDRWQSEGASHRGYGAQPSYPREDYGRHGGVYGSDTSPLDDYDRASRSTGPGRAYGGGSADRYRSDGFSPPRHRDGYGARSFGAFDSGSGYGRRDSSIPPRQFDPDERGFFDRASDEVMSWLGDDDAARRREMDHRVDHRGKGPAGYTRSSERLIEDANERLMHDSSVDASNITVTGENNEITLNGTVASRSEKRRAEDIVEDIAGVKHVQNNLRVEARDAYYGQASPGDS